MNGLYEMRGGILIIGSLLWDSKEQRVRWREENLSVKSKFRVYLPIRYGRLSSSRNNTYTMVFSSNCYLKKYGLGTGWIVPLLNEIDSFDEVKEQAFRIGEAEGIENKFTSNWVTVAIKINPKSKFRKTLEQEWRNFTADKPVNSQIISSKSKTERPTVDSGAVLSIKWPQAINLRKQDQELDFLLATVTKPTITKGRYPTSYQIAKLVKKTNYFDENGRNEITTFQDKRIRVLSNKDAKNNSG